MRCTGSEHSAPVSVFPDGTSESHSAYIQSHSLQCTSLHALGLCRMIPRTHSLEQSASCTPWAGMPPLSPPPGGRRPARSCCTLHHTKECNSRHAPTRPYKSQGHHWQVLSHHKAEAGRWLDSAAHSCSSSTNQPAGSPAGMSAHRIRHVPGLLCSCPGHHDVVRQACCSHGARMLVR